MTNMTWSWWKSLGLLFSVISWALARGRWWKSAAWCDVCKAMITRDKEELWSTLLKGMLRKGWLAEALRQVVRPPRRKSRQMGHRLWLLNERGQGGGCRAVGFTISSADGEWYSWGLKMISGSSRGQIRGGPGYCDRRKKTGAELSQLYQYQERDARLKRSCKIQWRWEMGMECGRGWRMPD